MTSHSHCPHCGRDDRPLTWPDRHPAAAVTAGLFTLVFMAMMLSEHPVAAAVMLILAGAAALVWLVDRERDRRAAIAARAEQEYRLQMAQPMPAVQPLAERRAHTLPWQLATRLGTEPLQVGRPGGGRAIRWIHGR